MAIKTALLKSMVVLPLCLGLMSTVSAAPLAPGSDARDRLETRVNQFHLLDDQALLTLESGFATLLRAQSEQELADARKSLKQVGFEWQMLDEDLVMLADTQGVGLGHYVFRINTLSDLMLQAPHQFFDRFTGQLSIDLFARSNARVLALNSAHRRLDIRDRSGNADIAHLERTALSALTRAFGLAKPTGVVVQLHGFAEGKRRSEAGRTADIIISSGQRWLQPVADRMATCLTNIGLGQVRRYPLDVGELGGTTNTQGAALRRLGNNRFVHLELSRALRERLLASDTDLNALGNCLPESNGDPS
ncbi:hypothetical protein [Marinobacter shengliensis]|uniref:hypothetical protein n=1 Tax=Marinobacter TaxID=2742 RepID=UPI001E3FC70C|nr:hypothetical protein [Marinobacter shengliensis]MCD1631934.1 hypothetical protein [Marinobacter shengliensis]